MDGPELRAVLAENIRAAAEAKGLSITALADFATVSRSQMFDVLACKTSPTIDWLGRVAGALDVPPHELLTRRASGKSGRARRRSRVG